MASIPYIAPQGRTTNGRTPSKIAKVDMQAEHVTDRPSMGAAQPLARITTPYFRANEERWKWARDLVRGGKALAERIPSLSLNETADSKERRQELYVDRVKAHQILQTQRDILAMGAPWRVTIDGSEEIAEIAARGVDGRSQSLLDFCLDGVAIMLAYGECYTVVDRRAAEARDIAEADAEMAYGTPYAYHLTPLEVRAAMFDGDNEIIQAIIASAVDSAPTSESMGFPTKTEDVYTLWRPDMLLTQDKTGATLREGANPLGFVPIIHSKIGLSLLENMESEIQACNLLWSMGTVGMSKAIIGMMIAYTNEDLKALNIGMEHVLKLAPGDKMDMQFTPTEAIVEAKKTSDEIQDGIRRAMRDRMWSMSKQVVEQSGASKKMDNLYQEAFSRYLAGKAETMAREIVSMMGQYYSVEPSVEIVTPRGFMNKDDADVNARVAALGMFQPKDAESWAAKHREMRNLLFPDLAPEKIVASDASLDAASKSAMMPETISTPTML